MQLTTNRLHVLRTENTAQCYMFRLLSLAIFRELQYLTNIHHCYTALTYVDRKMCNGSGQLKHLCTVLHKYCAEVIVIQEV